MDLAGQPFDFAHGRGNRGYAMAALLVGMSVMAVLMGALLPVWTTMAKREKEAELMFIRSARDDDVQDIVRIYIESWNAGFATLMPTRKITADVMANWTREDSPTKPPPAST